MAKTGGTPTMTEVPIIFPSHVGSPRRYIVNDEEKSIRRIDVRDNRLLSTGSVLEDGTSNAVHRGSASMSSLQLGSSATRCMLTTSVLEENPRILAVALSSGSHPNSPVVVELDLGSEIKKYSNTVKVQAFVDRRYSLECLRLVLVADNAVVITILLRPDDLSPLDVHDNVEVWSIGEVLNDEPAMKEAVLGSQVHKTMVAFYSPTIMVMALSPLLMSVDLNKGTCKVWLESQCLEEMRASQSTIGSLFSKASDLFLGKLEDGLVDMAPTAALCVSSTSNPLLDPTYVFTLHSDGKIKRWTVNESSLLPLEVYPVSLDEMPNPRDWSDMYNSVYLSARLYEQVYVLAVYIHQTNGSNRAVDNDDSESVSAGSNLFVIYGGQDSRVQSTVVSSQALYVPSEATSLVDMGFVPTLSSCSLMAMFRAITKDQSQTGTTITALYPPSMVSIICSQPEIAPDENFLDGVAQAERARIEALVLSDALETFGTVTLEDELHEMDSRFMKFLFRPAYPRGSGTVTPPQDHHIFNAIHKVVFGRIKRVDGEGSSMSVELQTLRAMQEWRTRENRKMHFLSPLKNKKPQSEGGSASPSETQVTLAAKTNNTSVYDSFVVSDFDEQDDDENFEMDDNDEMSDSDANKVEKERAFLLEMHSRRWRRLLLAIWEEEQSLRSPLGLFLLDHSTGESSSRAVLVRSGFTSIIAAAASNASNKDELSVLEKFDEAAVKLIKVIERDETCYKKLFSTEQRIWNCMAKSQMDNLAPSDFAEECSRVVDFAFDSAKGGVFSVQEQQQLGHALGKISLPEFYVLLQERPKVNSLPGLNLLGKDEMQSGTVYARNHIANDQVRQAVCSFSVRCIESSRRLLLARYLLVSYLVRSTRVSTGAFYLYLRSLVVLWAGSQHVAMPSAFKIALSSDVLVKEEPAPKRLSFGDHSSSILFNSMSTTTCMDCLLLSILQSSECSEGLPLGLVVSLGRKVYSSSMRSPVPTEADEASGQVWRLVPELGALPPSTNPSVATDYPRLAVRLVAPLVALGSTLESPTVTTSRKETLAECLLVEAHNHTSSETAKARMRIKACELLASGTPAAGDPIQVQSAIEVLQNANHGIAPLGAPDMKALAQKIHLVLFRGEGEIRIEVIRLTQLQSVRDLFAPLVKGVQPSMLADFEDAVRVLLPMFLHLSSLMHRVDILEHHVGRNKNPTHLVLEFINSTIRELGEMFPAEFCNRMPENLSLYNRLFHNAVSAGDWNQAYDACLNNPSTDRRLRNIERLVNGMVDAGALGELLDKCSTLGAPDSHGDSLASTDCVDMYSIAADTLEESCSRDLYLIRANSEDVVSAAPDYQGSLYALHVSRGQWKKATQSLDLRFVTAMKALATGPIGGLQDSRTAAVREKLIVEDLVLGSVGAANALSLVDDPDAQFVVAGENGQHLAVRSAGALDEISEPKRRLLVGGNRQLEEKIPSLTRIRQFMSLGDLEGRAAWSLVFRKLFLDSGSSRQFSIANSALVENGSPCVDKKALDLLFDAGYYLCGLLLSMAMARASSSDRNAFHESLLHLLSSALVPLCVEGKHAIPGTTSRPSLSQLRRALDNVGCIPGSSPFVVASRSKRYPEAINTTAQSFASALIQKLTCLHTNAEHPIGLDVANCFLDYEEKICQLPCWLEQLMTGTASADTASSGGLFGRRPTPGLARVYLGDPSALLTLYTRQGMLLDACKVVVSVLASREQGPASRREKATQRLPEKGDIDFVPYKKIDILCHLIDKTIAMQDVEEDQRKKLRHAQREVIDALHQHFALMKISELGIRSARALGRGFA